MSDALNEAKSIAFFYEVFGGKSLFWNALCDCDTTTFNGEGKWSFWQAFQVYEDITEHLCIWLVIHFTCWLSATIISRNLSVWVLSCITKPVIRALSLRQEGNCSVTKLEQWTDCHPPRMLSCIPDTQCIKQEFGRPAYKHSLWIRHTRFCLDKDITVMGTSLNDNSRGFPHHAGSWSNTPAKETAPIAVVLNKANRDCSPFCKCNCTA